MLNINQIEELENACQDYVGKSLVVSSWYKDNVEESFSSNVLKYVDVLILDKGIIFQANDNCDNRNSFLFQLFDSENFYININDIIIGEKTISLVFKYNGIMYSIVNLV